MSVYYDILTAVKASVDAAVGSNATTALRKRPVMLTGDPFPMVVISPSEAGETIDQEAFPDRVAYVYPVVICMYLAGDRVQDLQVEGYLSLRQTIRNAIYKPLLSGAGTVYDTKMDLGGPFVITEQRATVEVTTYRMQYLSDETRSA